MINLSTWFHNHLQVHLSGVLLLIMCMPIFPAVTPALVALLSLSAIIGIAKKRFTSNLSFLRKCWPFFGYFLALCVSLIWTEDVENGIATLENKLNFILLPLALLPILQAPQDFLKRVVQTWILACLVTLALCVAKSGILWMMEMAGNIPADGIQGKNRMVSSGLSMFLHPSYLAMYFNLAIFFLLRGEVYRDALAWKPFYRRVAIIVLTIGCLLLAAKSGILPLIGLFGWWLLILFRRGKWVLASAIVGGIILTSVALYHTIPEFANRMKSAVTHLRNDAPKNEEDSNAIRYLVWREARALIADYPILGVGAGDVNAKLKQRYIDAGLWTAPQRGLNAHSQFYQTHLAAGIAGTFFLLAILLTAIRAGRFRGLALFFGLLVVSNLLVEAMLERQAGVVFIVFFAVLLVYQPDKKAW